MNLDRELKEFHIRAGQVPILRILDIEDGISQDNIRYQLHMDRGALAKTIRPLISEGYITREKNKKDRRAYIICLTDKGHSIMPHLSEIIADWVGILTQNFSEEESKTAFNLLERMSDNAFEYIEKQNNNA